MSVQSEINRIIGLRDRIGDAIKGWGLAQSGADLQDYTEAIEGVTDRDGGGGEINTKSESISIPAGYYNGTGTVSISEDEQEKIIGSNIKQGVTILGTVGTYSGESANLQSKTVTPTKSQQSVIADYGYDALSQVTVNAIPDEYQDVSGVTAGASDVLDGKYIVTEDGRIEGSMVNRGAVSGSLGLTASSYTIQDGYHNGSGRVTLSSDIEEALAAI